MNRPRAQPPQLLNRFRPEELLLFGPDQIRLELACAFDDRTIDLIHYRPALQAPLYLSPQPRGLGPGLDRVNGSNGVTKPHERAHAHMRRLPRVDRAEKENPHFLQVIM